MTKKLEDLFNLEDSKTVEVEEVIPAVETPTHEAVDNLEKTSR
mgnify:CR=1 FL=1